MRYSEIISLHYGVTLPDEKLELVDAHYLGAAHHLRRFELSRLQFHSDLFARHLEALFRTVSGGDFSNARDPSGEGLEDCSAWLPPPTLACAPDPGMFEGFPCDHRYKAGQPMPYDRALDDPGSVPAATEEMLAAA